MKFLKLVALWVVLFISVFCLTPEELTKQYEKQLKSEKQARIVACSSPSWLIIASSSSLNGEFYPNKNIFDIDASVSHLSAVIDCSEEKLKGIQIICTSDNNERYSSNFVVRTDDKHVHEMQITNIDLLSEYDIVDRLFEKNSTRAYIGYDSDEVWYLLSWYLLPLSGKRNVGMIIFGKTLVNEIEFKNIRNKMFKQIECFYVSERDFGEFLARSPGDGKCDANSLTKGSKIAGKEQEDYKKFFLITSLTTIFIIFVLILGGFVLRVIVQAKDENGVEKVDTNTRFDCYTASN